MKKQHRILTFWVLILIVLAPGGIARAVQDATLTAPIPNVSGPPTPAPPPSEATEAVQVLDNFNRANGPLGSAWTVQMGNFSIVNNAAQGGAAALATFNGKYSDTAVEADVALNGTTLQYEALVLGYGALDNNLFIKVQQQNSVGYNFGGCYFGNNGMSGNFGLGFFALSQTFSTAHMRAELSGTDVTIRFTNIDGGTKPNQTYTCNGAPATSGKAIGMGSYDASNGRIDNFAADILWNYCMRDNRYSDEFRFNLEGNNILRGQATLSFPNAAYPAPLTGHYNALSNTLDFSIAYLNDNTRHYYIDFNADQAYTWAMTPFLVYYDTVKPVPMSWCTPHGPVPNATGASAALPE